MNRLLQNVTPGLMLGAVANLLALSHPALADGIVVSKIYDPYVQPLETELEWRIANQKDDQLTDRLRQSLGFGRSLSDRWAFELYAIGQKGAGESLTLAAYELELKRQLTEQGEYAVDWGLLFELERETEGNAWEFSTSVLASRDLGRFTATANLAFIYEWGQGRADELETALHVQTRYRLRETFEPAVELHMGQDTIAIGPAITGLVRATRGKKLRWEFGFFAGVDDKSPDQTIKASIEFEF